MKPRMHCCWALLIFSGAVWIPLTGYGQIQSLTDDSASKPSEPPSPVVWKITPAAEPQPPLRYRFWPRRESMIPGNTATPFHRSLVLWLEQQDRRETSQAFFDNYEQWMEGPLDELPKEEIHKYLDSQANVLTELHRMRNLRDTEYDLGIDNLRGLETVTFLLPEIQESRQLARLLALETRLALAEGRFEDAIASMQTGIRLSDTIGQSGDLLVIKLVGIAITGLTLSNVPIASELPESPNLYWALATIPESTYDVRAALEFESSFVSRVFPQFSDLPEASGSADAWRTRLTEAISSLQAAQSSWSSNPEDASASSQLLAGGAVLALAESSRQQLIDSGIDPQVVGGMSPSEAVVRATSMSLLSIQDNYSKWLLLPDSLQSSMEDRSEAFLQSQVGRGFPADLASTLARLLLPAFSAVQSAENRTAQKIAKLATAQAIRDYAASQGELPEKLENLSNLPAWNDPLTGDPFGYTRTSPTTATLTSAPNYSDDREAEIVLELVR